MKFALQTVNKKKRNLIVNMTDDHSNKEREVQDTGLEDIMYKQLLGDIHVDVETFMDEDDFEIDTGSRDGLQGIDQEKQVDGHSH